MYGVSSNQSVTFQETSQWTGRGSCSVFKAFGVALVVLFNAKEVNALPMPAVYSPQNTIPAAQMPLPALMWPVAIYSEKHYRILNAPQGQIFQESRSTSKFTGNRLDVQDVYESETFIPEVKFHVEQDEYGNTIVTTGEQIFAIAPDFPVM